MSKPPVVLITAGSAGLGAAAAKVFAKAGYNVAINYSSNQERADSLLQELRSLSARSKFTAIRADMSVREEIVKVVAQTVEQMGQLDAVFSNHGWTEVRGLDSLEANLVEDDWDRCFNMNVKSHLWLMHAAKPYLEASEPSGAFITTSSLAGVSVSGSSLAYSVSKAAQIHLAKGLAVLGAPKIRVNTVSPGLLLTDWGLKFSEEKREAYIAKTKLKTVPSVEDVAEQVLFFAKSRTITGQNMVCDAGWTL